MADQTAQIAWRGAAPISIQFDDPYFSLSGGHAETRHVFLKGNNLPTRFTPGFHIAELGFGTGLNMLAAWKCWIDAEILGQLHFTSFEQYPMALSDMADALANFPELDNLAKQFLAKFQPATFDVTLPGLNFSLITGDANQTLPNWPHHSDAWFLDGFSPAKNPELWSAPLMHQIAAHTAPNGTFATYTAAGHVRRALTDAGFTVTKTLGHGRKRHMTIGRLAP